MTALEISYIVGVIRMPGEVVDPAGKVFTGAEVPGSMAIALVLGGIERQVDHRAQYERGTKRMTLLQRVGSRGQEAVMIAVEFAGPGDDHTGSAVERRPVDQKGQRPMKAGIF